MVQRAQQETKHYYVCLNRKSVVCVQVSSSVCACMQECVCVCVNVYVACRRRRLRRLHSLVQHSSTWMFMMSFSPEVCLAKPSIFRWQNKCRDRELRNERCLLPCVLDFTSVHLHGQNAFTNSGLHACCHCWRNAFPCLFAFVHACTRVAFHCRNMCLTVSLPGSWWCHHPDGFAGHIQSCKRWCSDLRCRSGVQGYCIWALHCGLRVPDSRWLHTNNVHSYNWTRGGWASMVRESETGKETGEKKKQHI